MPKLLYISLARFPTEKAHGLQIAQNCEALAHAGYEVRLWVSARRNTAALRAVTDLHAHYGVDANFAIERVGGVDLYRFTRGNLRLERLAFYVHTLTYLCAMWLKVLFTPADVMYSRDEYVLLALSLFVPRHKLAYEAHLFASTARGAWLQRQIMRRVGSVVAITPRLRDDLIAQRGGNPEQIIVAHDGVRAGRFANLPAPAAARAQLGWPHDAFIVGFVGRLHMLNVDKGVGTLVAALAQVEGAHLALVGGPAAMAEQLRGQWLAGGLPAAHFLYAGQVAATAVPLYLRAMDVCAMPHPFTEQFAYYTSPLKLFEYMAAGRAIVASDLPGWADVVQHEVTALLVPPGDAAALADAIRRLRDDAALRTRLAQQAQVRVHQRYTWRARAAHITAHLARAQAPHAADGITKR